MFDLTRKDFQKLALSRIADAECLLRNRRYAGAYYLAGYAVECGLKACISKQTRRHSFPNKAKVDKMYKHDLPALATLAKPVIDLDATLQSDANFSTNWLVVRDWTEQTRYQVVDRSRAEGLITAINDPKHGVLKWLRAHW